MPESTENPSIATFSFADQPGVTYTATRGSGGVSGRGSDWITVVVTKPGVVTEDDPNPEPIEINRIGWATGAL